MKKKKIVEILVLTLSRLAKSLLSSPKPACKTYLTFTLGGGHVSRTEVLHNCRLVFPAGIVQGRESQHVLGFWVRSLSQQPLHCLQVAVVGGQMEWCFIFWSREVEIFRAAVFEFAQNFYVSTSCCQVER